MTELEKKLLATVERLDKESRERETQLMTYLQEVEERLNGLEPQLKELNAQYNSVLKFLKKLG